jgi:predicted transposase YdaD
LPLGVAEMVLTIVQESEAPEKARMLIGQVTQEVSSLPMREGIIGMTGKIMIYKFTSLLDYQLKAGQEYPWKHLKTLWAGVIFVKGVQP